MLVKAILISVCFKFKGTDSEIVPAVDCMQALSRLLTGCLWLHPIHLHIPLIASQPGT